jgi:glycosyltransferase involved in cell wall biosynthesis
MKDVCVDFGVDKNKIIVLKHFVDDKFYNLESRCGDYLLYFGRISNEKGIDILLEAMKAVEGQIKLKIVGDGPDLQKYVSLVKEYDLDKRIEFVGSKYGEELINYIQNAKAVIMPSVWPENMPYSLLESMSICKIVIASKIGGMAEMINNEESGFLFSNGSSRELAMVINRLDGYDLSVMGEKARERINNFKKENYYSQIKELYENLIK